MEADASLGVANVDLLCMIGGPKEIALPLIYF